MVKGNRLLRGSSHQKKKKKKNHEWVGVCCEINAHALRLEQDSTPNVKLPQPFEPFDSQEDQPCSQNGRTSAEP